MKKRKLARRKKSAWKVMRTKRRPSKRTSRKRNPDPWYIKLAHRLVGPETVARIKAEVAEDFRRRKPQIDALIEKAVQQELKRRGKLQRKRRKKRKR